MTLQKAAVFDPYLDTLGGGEVYSASVAASLMKLGYAVDIFWDKPETIKEINKYLGIDLSGVNLHPKGFELLKNKDNLLLKYNLLKQYSLIFYYSDGSVPFLFSKRNILHFQVPFTGKNGSSFFNKIKLKNIQHITVYSSFVKKFIDQEYGVDSKVLYPPVYNEVDNSRIKEKIILSVARFTDLMHNKRQDVLLDAFKQLIDRGNNGWKLVLIGNDRDGKEISTRLRKNIGNYPAEIITDADRQEVISYYSKASIFWHAAGYGLDQNINPEAVEHFGIATVEAMRAGCVPVVINKGGQPEIVKPGEDGFLWDSPHQLLENTLTLIREPETLKKLSQSAVKTSRKFSQERFFADFTKLITD